MKKYIRPIVTIVELQAKENIAGNPIEKAQVSGNAATGFTTVYNLSVFSGNSVPTPIVP